MRLIVEYNGSIVASVLVRLGIHRFEAPTYSRMASLMPITGALSNHDRRTRSFLDPEYVLTISG